MCVEANINGEWCWWWPALQGVSWLCLRISSLSFVSVETYDLTKR